MSSSNVIVVRMTEESDREEVFNLGLKEHQHAYVSPISNILKKLETKSQTIPFLIYKEDHLIGYVQINTNWEDIAHYCEDKQTLGLEAFFLDHSVQGQGLGVPSIKAILEVLPEFYPDYDKVALTVNCKNEAAIHTYLKGGFRDTGRLYHGGRSGPQHIMVAKL
ncbi:MAG TPA: GNAT family N-acetyltransferase [Balneolales bacterium]|nr:GNAT family N-acetyltransferase [Balneolales bacterium]